MPVNRTLCLAVATRKVSALSALCGLNGCPSEGTHDVHSRKSPTVLSMHMYSTLISGAEVVDNVGENSKGRLSRHRYYGIPFVSASEIAGLINVHPHVAVADAIERLWEKTNRKMFREALARNRLESFTQEERLKKIGALSLAKATVDTDDPKEYKERLATTLEKAKTVQDQNIVKDFVNTSRGTRKEKETFDILKEKRPEARLTKDANLYQKLIDIPDSRLRYVLAGYIDGVEANNQRLIEIKTRQSRLFHHVPLYEQVQCQAYLFLTGLPTCEHVESFQGTQLSTTLLHDPAFWNSIVERLNQVMVRFNRLLKDSDLQDDFLQRKELTEESERRRKKTSTSWKSRKRSKSLVFEAKAVKEE
jgi:hypothetical protein